MGGGFVKGLVMGTVVGTTGAARDLHPGFYNASIFGSLVVGNDTDGTMVVTMVFV